MLLSELIKELKEYEKKYGELEVFVNFETPYEEVKSEIIDVYVQQDKFNDGHTENSIRLECQEYESSEEDEEEEED